MNLPQRDLCVSRGQTYNRSLRFCVRACSRLKSRVGLARQHSAPFNTGMHDNDATHVADATEER